MGWIFDRPIPVQSAEERRQIEIMNALVTLKNEVHIMTTNIAAIKQAIADENVSIDHVLDVLNTQSASLEDVKTQLAQAIAENDPEALQAVADLIATEKSKVDQAIAALTPPSPSA